MRPELHVLELSRLPNKQHVVRQCLYHWAIYISGKLHKYPIPWCSPALTPVHSSFHPSPLPSRLQYSLELSDKYSKVDMGPWYDGPIPDASRGMSYVPEYRIMVWRICQRGFNG